MLSDNYFQLFKRRSRANFNQFLKRVSPRLNYKIGKRKKMKIILLSGIFYLLFVNISAQKMITCKKGTYDGKPLCLFSGVTIGPNEAVLITTNPENLDVNSIDAVEFYGSSIHSVPTEVFTKFQNLIIFDVSYQKLQEVQQNALWDGRKLELIILDFNQLTFLHHDTFKGWYFPWFLANLFFCTANLMIFIQKVWQNWGKFIWMATSWVRCILGCSRI